MKRLLLLFALLGTAKASAEEIPVFANGKMLHDGALAAKKCEDSCTPEQQAVAVEYLGYLQGITDIAILTSNVIDIPKGTTLEQISAVVRMYLEKNPRLWSAAVVGAPIVVAALAETFPKKVLHTEDPMRGVEKGESK